MHLPKHQTTNWSQALKTVLCESAVFLQPKGHSPGRGRDRRVRTTGNVARHCCSP